MVTYRLKMGKASSLKCLHVVEYKWDNLSDI